MSLALAACQTDGSGMARGSGGVAFVSIDGPPKPTFDKLVTQLSTQAESRQMKVASREDPNAYRVKGYLAVHVERGKGSVAYAWDIYDASKTRVARITGEERMGAVKPAAAWAACDDAVLARIADRSMTDLAMALGSSGSAASTPAPAAAEPAQAAASSAVRPAPEPASETPAADPGPASASGVPVAQAEVSAPALAYAAN